jgi:hypothetical protein
MLSWEGGGDRWMDGIYEEETSGDVVIKGTGSPLKTKINLKILLASILLTNFKNWSGAAS